MDYYKKDIKTVLEELNTKKDGLHNVDSQNRLEKYGYNELNTKVEISPIKIFIDQFKSFIIYILLFAVILSLFLQHFIDAALILIILLANALIGFYQEYSAQKSLEALKKLNKINAKVYRNEKIVTIDSKYLVPGDIVYLEAGDKVPADCRLIEYRKLKVEESSLTGESMPVEKYSDKIKDNVQISDQKNMLFSSTSISEGTAKAVVVKTGMETEIGKITKMITQAQEELTPLQKRLESFGKKLGFIIIFICILVFGILLITKGFSPDNMVVFGLVAVSLAVAAVPTALPAVVTIVLSVGVKRLLQKKALVRKLSSVETLGSCNVICTDKTGTLTQNQMTVREAWSLSSSIKIDGVGYNPQGHISDDIDKLLFRIGASCNNSALYRKNNVWNISGDPTEAALLVSARKAGIKEDDFEKIDEIPFDSNRKLMSVLIKENNDYIMHTKGAPNELIKKCSHYYIDGKEKTLDHKTIEKINHQVDLYSKKAMRVLAFAYKIPKDRKKDFTEDKLVFVGLQAMIDPPRPEVIEAIKKTKNAGIRVIMITGDYKETAKAIGKEIGITGESLTGEEIDKMSEEQLRDKLNDNTNIFARVIPEHKQRIVSALQKEGNIVAMTGDGVNDAPALKKANIGIAVGSGTDVAKEAADFVLLDDSFANIVNAIEEGRGIYDNIQKVIIHLLSGNLSEVLIIFLAVLLNFNLPLTAILLLWINLITDGAPALALSVDPYNKDIMKRKPIDSKEGILPKRWWFIISYLGFAASIIALVLFHIFGGNTEEGHTLAQTITFSFIVISETLLLLLIRNLYNTKMFSNIWLWATFVFSFGMQALVIFTPLSAIFNVTFLTLNELMYLAFGGIAFVGSFYIYIILQKLIPSLSFKKDTNKN